MAPGSFRHSVTVRYLEVDRQGVVFNMWYLAYCDDAMTAFLAHGGLPYGVLLDGGHDVQLVHSEIDWHGPLGFGDEAVVTVAVDQVGRTSFTLNFEVASGAKKVASVRTVYVVVRTDGSGKCDIPAPLHAVLGGPAS